MVTANGFARASSGGRHMHANLPQACFTGMRGRCSSPHTRDEQCCSRAGEEGRSSWRRRLKQSFLCDIAKGYSRSTAALLLSRIRKLHGVHRPLIRHNRSRLRRPPGSVPARGAGSGGGGGGSSNDGMAAVASHIFAGCYERFLFGFETPAGLSTDTAGSEKVGRGSCGRYASEMMLCPIPGMQPAITCGMACSA
eukprot:363169-Chlamydomonas_euryale.AAC.39